tara:strand:+ start:226 stop:453 length:228 start_codon:yes stop_codon:yes gene_type:complete
MFFAFVPKLSPAQAYWKWRCCHCEAKRPFRDLSDICPECIKSYCPTDEYKIYFGAMKFISILFFIAVFAVIFWLK